MASAGLRLYGRRFDERSDRRGGPQWLTADHARERLDTLLVERRPGLGTQVVDRVLLRPRVAVDPLRDQRVVDVADGEDPSVERELAGHEAARVSVAVEPLVMVAYEPADAFAESAELGEKAVTAFRVLLDGRVLVVIERPRLLQDRIRDRELADVVDEPADRERP